MASRRKKPKKSRKANSGAAPSQPFKRVGKSQPAPFVFRRATLGPDAINRRHVYEILRRRGVVLPVAQRIAYSEINPNLHYMVQIYGYASSDPNDDGAPGDVPVLQATYVGQGRRVWSRIVGYAAHGPIDDVVITQLDPEYFDSPIDRPLWDKDSVHTVTGERVYGSGQMQEYRDRKKQGARKKGGGGMSAPERRKHRKGKTAALRRKQALMKRYNALKDKDPVAAARLLERSKRARKYDL